MLYITGYYAQSAGYFGRRQNKKSISILSNNRSL